MGVVGGRSSVVGTEDGQGCEVEVRNKTCLPCLASAALPLLAPGGEWHHATTRRVEAARQADPGHKPKPRLKGERAEATRLGRNPGGGSIPSQR